MEATSRPSSQSLLKFHQLALLIIYPVVLAVAVVYSAVGHPPESYFSKKHNVFNKYFVKIGWFWVTLLHFIYLYLVRSKRLQNTNAFIGGAARYALMTLYWYCLTQWLFGPSFIDRVYVLSGGKCVSLLQDVTVNLKLATVIEQRACRKLGGSWSGGHDVSGHCVLLIHASMFLWEEISWIFYNAKPLATMKARDRAQYWSVVSVLGLLGLWLFMLFNTGVYFHGHFEILSGAFFGFLGWSILYLVVFPLIPSIGLPSINL